MTQLPRRVGCVAWFVTMLGLAGCDATTVAIPVTSTSPVHLAAFDVGVVAAGRTGCLCLPLTQVGVNPDERVVSVSSSRECLRPRLVEYMVSGTSHAPAILLEYADENAPKDSAGDDGRTTAWLVVVIELTLADGDRFEFAVKLIHTRLVGEDGS